MSQATFQARPDLFFDDKGRHRYAFVTFLMMNDSYLPGALVLAYSLRRQGVQADLVCLVTPEITERAIRYLGEIFDRVIPVNRLFMKSNFTRGRPATSLMFTRMNALRLGKEGDLGSHYDKIVVLDSDVLAIREFKHLFTIGTPAGILNERKEHLLEPALTGDISDNSLLKWRWHEVYESLAPHGTRIPRHITDRVLTDPTNLGVIGALFILEPSMHEYNELLYELRTTETIALIRNQYRWPDMQYLTGRWSGKWHNVDVRFASLNGYPEIDSLFGIHYGGIKPWSVRNKSFRHYSRFPDFRLWQHTFREMMGVFPKLGNHVGLRRLSEQIDALE